MILGLRWSRLPPETSRSLHDFAEQADLVIWDARSGRDSLAKYPIQALEEKRVGRTPVLMVSTIVSGPYVLRRIFATWLDDYPATFADAFLLHLIEAATARLLGKVNLSE